MNHPTQIRRASGFTLIEMICVIAIIALLASLLFPVVARMTDKADTAKCLSNLRQVGIGVNLYANEHNNTLPVIETDPTNPVYDPSYDAKPIAVVLAPYGISKDVLICPADGKAKLDYKPGQQDKGSSFFDDKGSSYEWRPLFDGDVINAPKIYTPRGTFPVPQSRVRLLADYCNAGEAPHERTETISTYNNLFADGTVRTLTVPKADVK